MHFVSPCPDMYGTIKNNVRCVFQSKQKSYIFFLPEQVLQAVHTDQSTTTFLFLLLQWQTVQILIPRVVYPQKGIFIFCSIEHTKNSCVHTT